MRIISQTGTVSINFDNCILSIMGNDVVGNVCGEKVVLGRYGTPERAGEVFADMHQFYDDGFEYPFDHMLEVYEMPKE